MASSRIFVRGLPPTISESDLKKHFAITGSVTDTKLFANRRIGYVGYESAEEAEKAVKYFNKTFIRMSKLAVELARPVADSPAAQRSTRASAGPSGTHPSALPAPSQGGRDLKRKRGSTGDKPSDPKLQEFLNAVQRRPDSAITPTTHMEPAADTLFSDESDEEIQTISKKPKQVETGATQPEQKPPPQALATADETPQEVDIEAPVTNAMGAPTSDSDWLRSRTNRLLDIEEDGVGRSAPAQTHEGIQEALPNDTSDGPTAAAVISQDDQVPDSSAPLSDRDATEAKITESKRLFLRNLAYKTTEDDLRKAFSSFTSLVEVRAYILLLQNKVYDERPDRDNLCNPSDATRERIF